jgi:hypothetical protein
MSFLLSDEARWRERPDKELRKEKCRVSIFGRFVSVFNWERGTYFSKEQKGTHIKLYVNSELPNKIWPKNFHPSRYA